MGFIDKAGVMKIPDKYNFADNFSEGLARVAIKLGVSVGYIDHDGTLSYLQGFPKPGTSLKDLRQHAPKDVSTLIDLAPLS